MGYNTVAMNNPIPNPANQQVNSGNPALNRSNSFENDPYTDDQGMHFEKMRKRRHSSQVPSGTIPNDVYMNQAPRAKLVNRRRSPASFPVQQGTSSSQSPQGTGPTQSTPPNYNSPSQNQSPSETMGSVHKQNYPFYPAGKNPQYTAPGLIPGSGGTQTVPNYMTYSGQPPVNYQEPNSNPSYGQNNNYFAPSMKGPNGNYMVAMNPQKAIYAHPAAGRFNMSGMGSKNNKPPYMQKQNNISMNDQSEGDSMNQADRDSNMGVDNLLSNDQMYRNITEPDTLYTGDQSINSEGSMDSLFN